MFFIFAGVYKHYLGTDRPMVFSAVWWREGELVGKQAVIPILRQNVLWLRRADA